MAVSSLTLNFDAILSATLMNLHKKGTMFDQISTTNALLFFIMKKNGMYTGDAEGERMRITLLYEMGVGDVFSGYDTLGNTPAEGITTAFFNWGQLAVPIAISGKEERENASSQTRVFDLLKGKTKQALLGAQDLFAKALIQGNGPHTATAITTAYTSNQNGSVFIDPLPELIHFSPTTALTVGNIAQGTYSWWRNQTTTSTATTFAGFLKELDNLYNKCSKGPGGMPDVHMLDQKVFELYVAALRNQNRFTDYLKADIPFESVAFHGKPTTWDQFVPDAKNGTITGIPVDASGTWYMINSQYLQIKYFQNFEPTAFARPTGASPQDAKLAHIMWHGGIACANRRKQGVIGGISTTITS